MSESSTQGQSVEEGWQETLGKNPDNEDRHHGQGLATLTKDIPISNTSLFWGGLCKVVAKAASTPTTTWHLVTVLSCLASLGLSHPREGSRSQARRKWQGQSSNSHRDKRSWPSKGKGANSQVDKHTQQQWQQPKSGSKPKPKPRDKEGKKSSNA